MKRLLILFPAVLLMTIVSCTNNAENEVQKETKISEKEPIEKEIDYLQLGSEIAGKAQQTLGSNLMKAMNDGGPINALTFCNLNAIKLTDSMAIELNASIRRVTDLPRNPKNKANQKELEYILNLKAKAEGYSPKMQEIDGKMVGYYPIVTNDLCLKCHGTEKSDIDPKTLAKIDEIYPKDKARFYSTNEIRGLWVVELDKKQ